MGRGLHGVATALAAPPATAEFEPKREAATTPVLRVKETPAVVAQAAVHPATQQTAVNVSSSTNI